ncbi:MAG: transketolase [Thermomicrobiales bacterium]
MVDDHRQPTATPVIDGTTVPRLQDLSRQARRLIVQSVFDAGAGHLGGPLSAADLLIHLYFNQLNLRPDEPGWPDRDRFILSKGHSSIGLYAVLALRGFMPIKELKTFDQIDSRLQGHPDMRSLPGLDMSTGSLGQGLSPGVGMALAARLRGQDFRTWVMLGDGEIQEGQIWEACFTAARYELDNLTAILDFNRLPQFGWPAPGGFTRDRPIDDPAGKFRAFGWHVVECEGHDHAEIRAAFDAAVAHKGQPSCVVAHTVKGKGVSFMEGDYLWHAQAPTDRHLADALAELAVIADKAGSA